MKMHRHVLLSCTLDSFYWFLVSIQSGVNPRVECSGGDAILRGCNRFAPRSLYPPPPPRSDPVMI